MKTSDVGAPYAEGPIPWIDPEVQACFPTSGPIHRYMHWITQTTDTPALFHLASILPFAATKLAWLGFKLDVQQPFRLWTLLVNPAGSGKSTPIKRAEAFFLEHVQRTGGAPVQAASLRFEGTVAGLFNAIQGNYIPELKSEIFTLHTDEAGALFTKRQQESGGAKFLCQLYDAERMERTVAHLQQAVKKKEIFAPVLQRPIVSTVFACTMSEFTAEHMKSLAENGLLTRFLLFKATKKELMPEELHMPELREHALIAWEERLGQLFAQRYVNQLDDPALTVRFTKAARAYHRSHLFDTYADEYKRDPEGVEQLLPFYRRAEGQAYVAAAVFALMAGRMTVGEEDMRYAVEYVTHSIGFAKQEAPQLGRSEGAQMESKVLRYLEARGTAGASLSELGSRFQTITAGERRKILSELDESGEVVCVLSSPTPGQRKPTRTYYLQSFAPVESKKMN